MEPLPFECPNWCKYRCRDDWQQGHCLILKPERTKELYEYYKVQSLSPRV